MKLAPSDRELRFPAAAELDARRRLGRQPEQIVRIVRFVRGHESFNYTGSASESEGRIVTGHRWQRSNRR